MDWIKKLKEEQQRKNQAHADALKQASEQKECFQIVKDKLCPVVETAIVEIKKRMSFELQMDIGDTSLIVRAPHPRPKKYKDDDGWWEEFGRISDHRIEISDISDDGKTVCVEAIKAGKTNRNPDEQPEDMSYADYFGTDETVINTRNDIDALVSEDIHLLLEWLVRLELQDKDIAPPELSSMRQRKEQEKSALLKANLGIASVFLFLGPIAFFLGLRAKKELSSLGIVDKGHGRSNWAIGLGIFECIIIGINILAMPGAPYRQSIFGEKSLQMRTSVSTSYPSAADVKSIPNLSGKWKGSYTEWDAQGIGRNIWFEMELKQNGAQITGITTELRDYRTLIARINGSVEGRVIRFVKQYNSGLPVGSIQSIEYEGNIADDGNSISGIWKTSVLTMRWSVSRVSKNESDKGSSLLRPEVNPAPKTTSGFDKTGKDDILNI